MKEFKYVITDPQGIHARPAGLLVKACAAYPCAVKLTKDGKTVDSKRLLAVMSLAVKAGQEVTFTFDGEKEDEAYEAVTKFLKETL